MTGNVTSNAAPFPASDTSCSVPPCSRTMPKLIESPSPVPTPRGFVV